MSTNWPMYVNGVFNDEYRCSLDYGTGSGTTTVSIGSVPTAGTPRWIYPSPGVPTAPSSSGYLGLKIFQVGKTGKWTVTVTDLKKPEPPKQQEQLPLWDDI